MSYNSILLSLLIFHVIYVIKYALDMTDTLCSLSQPSLWYHSSAVLALALDALTLPYRLRNNSVPMWQLADTLAVSGRKVTALFCLHHVSVVEGQSSW